MEYKLSALIISISLVFSILSIGALIWMRWRMKASKGRFALSVVSAIINCLILGLTAAYLNLPTAIISKISEALGFGPISSGVPGAISVILTISAMIFIYRFGITTIKSWDAPPRVSEIELSERYLENDLATLAITQIKMFLRGQQDRLASETATNWKAKIAEAPQPSETKDLLKDMLVSAVNEIRIYDDGWRADGKFWVGEILGIRPDETKPVIVFICDDKPTKQQLDSRIKALESRVDTLAGYAIYALFFEKEKGNNKNSPIYIGKHKVTVLSSINMILNSLDLVYYAQEIIYSFEKTRVGGTTATLKSSFVDVNVDTSTTERELEDLSKEIGHWLSKDSGEHIALTGEYGQGKSTALLKYCYDWAVNFTLTGDVGVRIPLLIELRGQSPGETDPLGFISPWCSRYRLSAQQVLNLIKSGDALIIFEGFDELRNAGRAFFRHQHFNALWRFAYPGTKIIFTGRPNFFLDQEEANRTLRSQESRKLSGDIYTTVWKLKKLEPQQIAIACRNYDQEVRDGIVSAISTSSEFLDIVSRPSMLPVVATIWGDISALQARGTPLTGAVLIEKYIQAIFSRKEAELEQDKIRRDAPSGSRYLVLPKQIREILTVCVAWRMSGIRAKNTISRAEIVEMVRDVYDVVISQSKSDGVAPVIVEGIIEFERRFSDEKPADRVEAIAAEICSAGLLVPDAAGGSTNLRFPHKQFFEFLIAKGVAIVTSPDQLIAASFLEKCSNDSKISGRLRAEPNSIAYLVEVIGPDLTKIMTKYQRLAAQVSIINVFAINKIYKFLSTKSNLTINHYNDEEISINPLGVGSINDQKTSKNVASSIMMFSTTVAMASTAAGGFELVTDGKSLLIYVAAAFAVAASFIVIKFIYDIEASSVPFYFINTAWIKADAVPKNRSHAFRLAFQSFGSGKVEYPREIKREDSYAQFLYPANYFGGNF